VEEIIDKFLVDIEDIELFIQCLEEKERADN